MLKGFIESKDQWRKALAGAIEINNKREKYPGEFLV